ncbi:peptidyl-prolyl cis-trans isomerase B (cyclophilin B) [Pedococcus dokdonensis]|uniref:Peptidyl-prolyl cis-trans isomerase B (Cyclophilin B) n=1 Tax=Pedococcus dokdonensis TaxID=443156 RepID=A0A1H0NJC2_9MICO|nr:peptidylprolyl isomerase [Pedococcus dokdonensis]SDO92450.1 peptidyl-prolyl cis-trans isomerase B (cyclophilin B) [Pedococcus dokdonensis]
MTREQERARERRRAQKFEAKQALREREAARNRQVAVVVAAVLVVVAAFVILTTQLGKDDKATPSAEPTGSTQTTASATTTAAPVAGCTAAPAPPTSITKVAKPDKATAAGKTFTAVVTTNCGDITIQLDGAKAPQTVASFVALAKASYFGDSPCHRITTQDPLFVLQCGDPLGGSGTGPGYTYGIENAPKDGKYPKGTVAMARTNDPNSNADQFFIVYKDSDLSSVPEGYSIFGTVTGGMDIVEKIAAAGVSGGATDGAPAAPISILKVAVTEKKA